MNRNPENPNVLSLQSEMSDMNITPPSSPPSSAPGKNNIYRHSHGHDTASASTTSTTEYKAKYKINDEEMKTAIKNMNTSVSPTIAQGNILQDARSPTRNEHGRVQPHYLRRTPTLDATNTSNTSTTAAASKFTISSPPRGPNQGYHFFRTHSSPCVIDASPKTRYQENGLGMGTHKSELTPIMRNTNFDDDIVDATADGSNISTNTSHNNNNKTTKTHVNSLSFPETKFFQNTNTNTTTFERRNITDDNHVDASISPSSQIHRQYQHQHSIDGINRNTVNIRPRNTPNHHDLNLDPLSPPTTRLVSPPSIRTAFDMLPPPPPPLPSSMSTNGAEMMDEEGGGDEQRYASPSLGTLLTQPIPLGRNCHSLTSPNEYKRWQQLQTQQQSLGGEYAVPPSSPTSPSHDNISGDTLHLHHQHRTGDPSPPRYMVPYQPSRDSSLASYGVVTDDVNGIFLAPRRRRQQRQQAQACGGGENSDEKADANNNDNDECMESWDGDQSVGEGGDDGSIASSSIPSIRMAVRLNSSTITHEEQGDSSLLDMYGNRFMMFDSENDVDNHHYLDEQQQQHIVRQPQQHHRPLDMAVTPSPPRRASRPSFQNTTAGISSNREGGEWTEQGQSQKLHNGALEWLKTVEVGRNNQYVAEAASSKFLTGKRSHPATNPSNVNNNLMNSFGGGGGGGMMMNGYDIGKRVHSTGTQNPNIMITGRQHISSSAAVAPVVEHLKGNICAPAVTATLTSAVTTATNGHATSGAVGVSNTRRTQVMGRSMNMFHGPTRGVRRGGRGSTGVSRTRASAVTR